MLVTPPLSNSFLMAVLLGALMPLAELPLVDDLVQTARITAGVGMAVATVEGEVGFVGAII